METIEFSSKVKNGIIRIPQKYKNIENANVKKGIDKSIAESSIDNYSLLEKARTSAWEVYKDGFLKEVKTDS